MIYEIQSKQDLSGPMLIIRFPEKDLDYKALYTIQADQPDFLVPFRFRNIDGEAECTYLLSDCSKLQYRYGSRTTPEYVEFWNKILQPLLDCSDWFLKPLSFVLDSRYLYVNKDGKTVSYLYVPTKQNCVEYSSIQEMVVELSSKNTVADSKLENKVLKAIMQDFQPMSFLKMLRENEITKDAKKTFVPTPAPMEPSQLNVPVTSGQIVAEPKKMPESVSSNDDIVINLNSEKANTKENKKKKDKKEKKEKKKLESTDKQKKKGLFGWGKDKKENNMDKEIVLGAAADMSKAGDSLPLNRASIIEPAPVWTPTEEDDATQLDESGGGVHLRLVGDPSLPREISINIAPGQAFTIGRFDVSVGHRQSDFEFDKKTKAVSRRHAAIECGPDGEYTVVDLSSSAGTFLNGDRLLPNMAYRLEFGYRLSFGTSGADYIWEA